MDRHPARKLPGLRESLARFGRATVLLRPYWADYAKLLAWGAGLACIGLAGPMLTKLLVDRVYPTRDIGFLGLVVAAILVYSLFTSFFSVLRNFYAQTVGAHVQTDTTVFLLNHLQHLPLRFFRRMPVGDVLSRFGDMHSALGAVTDLSNLVFLRGIYLVIIPPVLVAMNWRLALVALATTPATSLINILTARTLRRRWKRVAEARAEVQALNVETLSHIRVLKGLERNTLARTMNAAFAGRDETVATARLAAVLGAATGLVRTCGMAVFTYFGWSLVLNNALTLGSFLAFSAYLGLVQGPLAQVTSTISKFQQTAVTLDRVFEMLDEPTEADPNALFDPSYAARPLEFDGSIQLEGVRFQYPASSFSLDIPELGFEPGTVTGIIGETGSGKSTLLRLLAGLEAPISGTIWYGKHAHHRVPLAAIRQSVAVAWQTPELLRGSLRSNITFGSDEEDEQRLLEVIEICQLRNLLQSLPDGLDTPVSEWGATLSGGEQQRLSLARAIMRQTPIILLDEVTSNLDGATEEALMRSMMPHLHDRTVVLVSHRPSTLRDVDHVATISGGKLVIEQNLSPSEKAARTFDAHHARR